jgi:glycosyltransferase involved in cell wall biosynthesis
MKQMMYASFDEVPSFKGASTHILGNCRTILENFDLKLHTLGTVRLPSRVNFEHIPHSIQEKNYLRRGQEFRHRIEKALGERSFDIIHFRSPWEGIPAIHSGAPTIYEANGFASIELTYHYRGINNSVIAKLFRWEKFCLKNSYKIICPSERIKECILKRYGIENTSKIHVIQNACDLPSTKLWQRYQERKPEDGLRFVYIGTLAPWQGIHWALKAFRETPLSNKLDIISPPHKRWTKILKKRIAKYNLENRVELLEPQHRRALSEHLLKCDVGIAPLIKSERNSIQGCSPLKILEYQAHGNFIIASDLSVVRELEVPDSGIKYFHPNSLSAIREVFLETCRRSTEIKQRRMLMNRPTEGIHSWQEVGQKLEVAYAGALVS